MSRKTNRLRQRLQVEKSRREDGLCAATREIQRLRTKVSELESRLAAVDEFKGFRLAVERGRPFSYDAKIYSLSLAIDPRAIGYGFRMASRDAFGDLSRHVFYVVDEIAHKARKLLIDEMVKDGAIR